MKREDIEETLKQRQARLEAIETVMTDHELWQYLKRGEFERAKKMTLEDIETLRKTLEER